MNIKKHHRKIIWLAVTITTIAGGSVTHHLNQVSQQADEVSRQNAPITQILPSTPCLGLDEVWKHVYSGDPRKFAKPQDRLQIIEPCKTVTGILKSIKSEKDGDIHARLTPNQQGLVNQYNVSGQKGDLVLETVCNTTPTQADTIKEGVCNNFSQNGMITKDMIGKHIEVIGAYVEDQEHGWREIHPVLSIVIK